MQLNSFVLSNSTWKNGKLTTEYRQPFDLLARNVVAFEQKKRAGGVSSRISEDWLPGTGSNRRPSD